MRYVCTACLLFLLFLPLRAAAPEISGPGASAITAYLRAAVQRGDVPGMVALVTTKDRVIYHEAFGKLNVARDVDLTPDAIFQIASMTKPITSVAIMMLVDQGRLKLDDDASKYIPELASLPVLTRVDVAAKTYETRPARRPITIRQLLTHTSGLGYPFASPELTMIAGTLGTSDELKLPLLSEPGERWNYGASTKVLGDIITKVTGQTIDRYLTTRILAPLGMQETSFTVPQAKVARVITQHNRDASGRYVEEPPPADGPRQAPPRGDGGLFSTATDYARFMQMLLNNGSLNGTRILSRSSMEAMKTNQIGALTVLQQPGGNPAVSRPFPLGAGRDKWSLGFQLATTKDPRARSVGSLSWAGAFNTEFWIDPSKGIGAVLLMQTLPFYDAKAIETLQGFEAQVYGQLR